MFAFCIFTHLFYNPMKKIVLFSLILVSVSVMAQKKKAVVSNDVPMVFNTFDTIRLQTPDTTGGMPLMQAISRRKTDRKFESRNLSLRHLSNLLWVANGINRANGKRTVPSAMAQYPLHTYAVLENGIYYYNPQKHQLEPVVQGHFQELTGRQPFVESAPLNLLFIAKAKNENDDFRWAMMDSGYCGQNLYLYCASEGLKTVVRGGAQEAGLLKAMKLDAGYKFILAQTVGY